jgi:hypothetical protein
MAEQRGVVLRQAAEEAPPDAADELRRKAVAHETDVLPTLTDGARFEDLLARVDSALDKAEQHLAEAGGARVWLLGDDISAVDIALGVILNQLTLLGLSQRLWAAAKRPRLARLLTTIQKRASFTKAVLEVGDPGALDSAADDAGNVGGVSLAMELSDRPMASAESLEVWHELQSGARADEEEVVDGEDDGAEDEGRTWRSLW